MRSTGVEVDQMKERLAVSEWFRQRYEWIMAGRTTRSRAIRRAIVEAEIDGTEITAIARRFKVQRQSVHRQLLRLRKRHVLPSVKSAEKRS